MRGLWIVVRTVFGFRQRTESDEARAAREVETARRREQRELAQQQAQRVADLERLAITRIEAASLDRRNWERHRDPS